MATPISTKQDISMATIGAMIELTNSVSFSAVASTKIIPITKVIVTKAKTKVKISKASSSPPNLALFLPSFFTYLSAIFPKWKLFAKGIKPRHGAEIPEPFAIP